MPFPKTWDELKDAGYEWLNDSECRGCGEPIMWFRTPKGKSIPINSMSRGTDEAVAHWAAILDAIPDVETWNRNIPEFKRLAEQYGEECRKFIMDEAARRGYLYSKGSKCFVHPWHIVACAGKNLIGVGWKSGQLAVVFASEDGARRYESVRHDIPKEIAQKLLNSPYPDALYQKIVKKKGIEMVRVK